MSEPTPRIEIHFHPATNSFHEEPSEDSWSIFISTNFRWHFTDMDSNSEITLHPLSAREVEAGYQAHRAYLEALNDPHGREGQELRPPPKEIVVRQGFYAGKKYRVSFSNVVASRLSKRPVKDKSEIRHVEVYQQNSLTGFMRTLYRTPADSRAKPFSGLQVASSCRLDSATGRISKMRIDVSSGKSFFGYRYPRTLFTFSFRPEEKALAQMMHDLYLDGEMFRLEVPRDENAGSLFPVPDGRAAKLVLKQRIFEAGLEERHFESQILGDMDDVVSLRHAQCNNPPVEGEPDVDELCDEKFDEEEPVSWLSKFDVYSFVDRVRTYKQDDYHQYIVDNLEEESIPEYQAHHIGEPCEEKRIQVPGETFFGYTQQILASRDDVKCMVFQNGCNLDRIGMSTICENATVAKKDAIYNKLVSQIKTGMVALVTVKVSDAFRLEYGNEGVSLEDENDNAFAASFVSYLGFDGKLMLLTSENARSISERWCC